ncbi:hypothetical protein M9978_18155 [Sphingomonas sp. MG17]|uniref:Uncharacterized protein n=1 Tax=Sphingomonas tagetis TaxID=2949092 RepID=A0A9X2HRT6_9SPHN|nr:hypothetical protein [Sphingomonas tagetis]MCP3732348.1 hypothetical protein [Sphingomonas tagetis]
MIDTDANSGLGWRSNQPWGCWIGLLSIVVALVIGYGFVTGYLPIRPFDSGLWRQARTTDNQVRLRMVEWLVRSGRLDGLTRAQVVKLLGRPDGGPYFRDWDLVYLLGPERGLIGLDSEWLVLRIGSDGRVAEYRVVRD